MIRDKIDRLYEQRFIYFVNNTFWINNEIYCNNFIFFDDLNSSHFTVEIMKYSVLLMLRDQRFSIISKYEKYIRNKHWYFTDPTPRTLNTQPIFRIYFFQLCLWTANLMIHQKWDKIYPYIKTKIYSEKLLWSIFIFYKLWFYWDYIVFSEEMVMLIVNNFYVLY